MSCLFCQEESVASDDNGNCSICHVAVCGPPSQRPDGAFHGARCGCDCGRFICDAHMRQHLRDNHASGSLGSCFKPYADWIGPASVVAASLLKSAVEKGNYDVARHGPHVATLGRFVNAFMLSDDEIAGARTKTGSEGLFALHEVPGGPQRVVLNPTHFSSAAADWLLAAASNYEQLKIGDREKLIPEQMDVHAWLSADSVLEEPDAMLPRLADLYLTDTTDALKRWVSRNALEAAHPIKRIETQLLKQIDVNRLEVERAGLGSAELRAAHARAVERVMKASDFDR